MIQNVVLIEEHMQTQAAPAAQIGHSQAEQARGATRGSSPA
jgi:hypothetical protein